MKTLDAFAVLAISDHDGDGVADFVTGATSNGSNTGIARMFTTFPATPAVYCTSQTNSLGCLPSIGSLGACSASSSASFDVIASSLLNQKPGLLFYGYAPLSTPYQGGYLCVHPPTVRTAVQNSGGATSGSSCTGAMSFDFNSQVQSGVDPGLGVGDEVYAQIWSRDPASASHTNLTNALRFLVGP